MAKSPEERKIERELKKAAAKKASKEILQLSNMEDWLNKIRADIKYQYLTREVMEQFVQRFAPEWMADYLKFATHYYEIENIKMTVKKVEGKPVEGMTYTKEQWKKIEWSDTETVKVAAAAVKADTEAKKNKQKPQGKYILKFCPLEAKKEFAKKFAPDLIEPSKKPRNATTGEELFLEMFNADGTTKKQPKAKSEQ